MNPSREQFKTYKHVFDGFTIRTLFELSSHGAFDELTSPLSMGKESSVFIAETQKRKKVIVKIYRLATADFRRMYDYIKFDPRFLGLRGSRRKVLFAWAQREYKSIQLAEEAGVAAPKPLAFKNHIIVEQCIGDQNGPSLRLQQHLPEKPQQFFAETIENIKKFYRAGMVHGDLSAFNILNHDDHPVFIDFSQGTVYKNPIFNDLLARDVRTVCAFFRKIGVHADEESILNEVQKEKIRAKEKN